MNLLSKYEKPIPKTWNELIETSQYIMKKEKEFNNTRLIAYNGLFNSKYKKRKNYFLYLFYV